MKKGFIIFAVVLAAIGLVLFAGGYIASGFDLSKLGTGKYETNTYTISERIQNIEISASDTDILFRPSADGTLSIVCEERENARHTVTVENGTMKIGVDDRREWFERISLFSKDPLMTVYLPSDTYESLHVECGTGDVSLACACTFGSVDVNVGTGDIETEGVRAGNIGLSVSTGKITAGAIACEDMISIDAGTGKAALTDVICKSMRSTGSTGDIALKDVTASDSFNIERSTGDIVFENCDAAQITARTTTGNVTGTLRTGKVFIAKTSTGSVNVPDTISGGRCEITTSTGKIDIRISDR